LSKIIKVSSEITKDRLNYLSNFVNSKLAEKDVNLTNLNNLLIDELDKIISFQERFNYIHKFLEECFDFKYSKIKFT